MEIEKIIDTIVISYDWEEVINSIIITEGMNPEEIDIVRLTDRFVEYLKMMKDFDFRIPARFILVAAILIRMKMELLLEKEKKKKEEKKEEPVPIKDLPPLEPPVERRPSRKVSLEELVSALNKVMSFKEKKQRRMERMRTRVEKLIDIEEETIEQKIQRTYSRIVENGSTTFTKLVSEWKRDSVVETFLSILYLVFRSKVLAEQEEMFGEIYIKLREKEDEVDRNGKQDTSSGAEAQV